MRNLCSKTNAPYLIAGALATLTLIASGTLAVAPYVGFLSSVAAFNVALPVAFSLSMLSALVLALSCKMISRNKKLDVKETELNEKIKLATEQENTIQRLEPQIKELRESFSSLATKEELSAAAKDGVKDLVAPTKEELGIKIDGAATKEELKKLSDEVKDLVAKVDSAATKDEVKGKLEMVFYAKDDKEREDETLDSIILPNDVRQKLKEVYAPHTLKKGGGYILYGPPGTGKTMIARAIANETKGQSAFISVSASDLFSISNMDKLFEKAGENTPCIVFIDEIEGFGKERDFNGDNVQYLDYFLTKFGGFKPIEGMTIVAATNHIEYLDSALVRGGRLSTYIKIPTLDMDTRKKMINEYCQKEKLQGMYTDKILRNTNENFSPANLISLLDQIKVYADKETPNATKVATICRTFKKHHNIAEVSSKQRTNGEINSFRGGSQQSQSGANTTSMNTPSKSKIPVISTSMKRAPQEKLNTVSAKEKSTSTPAKLSSKNPDEAFVQEPSDTFLSPITGPTETDTIENSALDQLPQNVSEWQSQRKSPKKENKENAWQQNQKSPKGSINRASLSPLGDATNENHVGA